MTTQPATGPIPASLQSATPPGRSFIEVQFPVSKLSKESYKERKAGASQAITALGKWWGRKPLVLVRAIILGLLLPATDDPDADRETFLALMTMDDDGMLRRLDGMLLPTTVHEHSTPREQVEYFTAETGKAIWRRDVSREDRQGLVRRAFLRMSYDQRLEYCMRPEDIDGPSSTAWAYINAHLGTEAESLPALVTELGKRRFGGPPRVGDVFCGGGSIPFEAARLGCSTYGSDLNPVAALLTWGSLNVVGGGESAVQHITEAQQRVFDVVQAQVAGWGIERNEQGWVADAYLYCVEVVDPATDWRVPLAPSWLIALKTKVVAKLIPDQTTRSFRIEIVEDVADTDMAAVKSEGTWSGGVRCPVDREGRWLQPGMRQTTGFERLRGPKGFRAWDNEDVVPRPADVLQERLYCIRWVDPSTGKRHYRAPTEADLYREQRVLELLRERFSRWQAEGILPKRAIEPGQKTEEPIRTRGWTRWHHLFNPRQLLLTGLFVEQVVQEDPFAQKALLLMIGRIINWNSRLCSWAVGSGGKVIGGGTQTFYNQALNALVSYSCRPMTMLESAFKAEISASHVVGPQVVVPTDAREVLWDADMWITDPGYGDMILYDELSEFFLAWYDRHLLSLFPGWYSDSKRALSVKGAGESFRSTLAECYRHITLKMRDDGFQVVMFTHQDPEVWADLALVLWAAGLKVTAAWTVATETSAGGLKEGNYVQGTVILVLRKRLGEQRGDLSDIYPDIQTEVRRQVRTMLVLDPKDDPNFGDADYQLAAYAAALRVLTSYSSIGEIDVERELRRTRAKGETSPVTTLIERAVRIASDELVPAGLDAPLWRKMGPEERLYLKGIAVEARGDSREGVYQELARGYGASDYRQMLASRAANKVRFKTPSEFANREMKNPLEGGFFGSLLRYVLYGVYVVAADAENGPRAACTFLRRELPDYWDSRAMIVGLLRYLQATTAPLPHWTSDVKATQLLLGAVENDSV